MKPAPVPQYGGLIRTIALMVGVLLLADSVSQLVQAAGSFEIGSRDWRLVNLRLLFTQITPLTAGLLLVGQYVVHSRPAWQRIGWLMVAVGLVFASLTAVYLLDAFALFSTLSGPPLGQLRRNMVQVLISGSAFCLALLGTGALSLRANRTA